MSGAPTPADRRRLLLGDELIAQIHDRARQAPPPSRELIKRLRPILTRPVTGPSPVTQTRAA
ncbi:hypothetical protein [Streptomyces sp. NPDC058155]|uniref:hypothetical protein n=1 Tax=Streptomyces sp. NPDC058155 TaxID=3346359 RepID=UPI0036DFC948